MRFHYKLFLSLGLSISAYGAAYADAFATGSASVSDSLFDVGFNGFGGTGNQITIGLWSVFNGNFSVFGAGPGSGSIFVGGGLLDGGFDAGSGDGWQLFGQNTTTGNSTSNSGYSDASNLIGAPGSSNFATEDTYNELVFKITNTSHHTGEYFNVQLSDGVISEVSLDNSYSEWGLDESLLQFGYTDSHGAFTGNVTTNEAFVLTGMAYGTDTFDIVANSVTDYYEGFLKPGQSIYLGVVSENYSAAYANVTPGPSAIAPFAIGLIAALRRRQRG